MNDINQQNQIKEDILKEAEDKETQYAEASKNELAKQLKSSDLGRKLEEIASQEVQKPSKWQQFISKIKRIFYYI